MGRSFNLLPPAALHAHLHPDVQGSKEAAYDLIDDCKHHAGEEATYADRGGCRCARLRCGPSPKRPNATVHMGAVRDRGTIGDGRPGPTVAGSKGTSGP